MGFLFGEASFITLILNFINGGKSKTARNKWLECEEGSKETLTKKKKKGKTNKEEKTGIGREKKREERTECFLVSSGGLAFV